MEPSKPKLRSRINSNQLMIPNVESQKVLTTSHKTDLDALLFDEESKQMVESKKQSEVAFDHLTNNHI